METPISRGGSSYSFFGAETGQVGVKVDSMELEREKGISIQSAATF